MITPESISRLISPLFEDNPVELLEIKIRAGRGKPGLLIIVDHRERGITLDECIKLSRRIEDILDMAPDIPRKYSLDVSSPGVDHPLKYRWQYEKNVGRELMISFAKKQAANEGMKPFQGTLSEVHDNELVFSDGTIHHLDVIVDARVVLPW